MLRSCRPGVGPHYSWSSLLHLMVRQHRCEQKQHRVPITMSLIHAPRTNRVTAPPCCTTWLNGSVTATRLSRALMQSPATLRNLDLHSLVMCCETRLTASLLVCYCMLLLMRAHSCPKSSNRRVVWSVSASAFENLLAMSFENVLFSEKTQLCNVSLVEQ